MLKVIKGNNDKYMAKIGNTDTKVSRILTNTQGLIYQYEKKIKFINSDVEKTNVIKDEIRYRQEQIEDKLAEL